MGPDLDDHLSAVFWGAFLLFSWTTGSIMSGALIERVRLTAYLVLTVILGSVIWILDAAWGWSAGGWLTTGFGFHDSIASAVVHGVAGAFTLGVLFQLGPRIGKYDVMGRARTFRPHNLHLTLLGLMLIFTGFYAFYAACLVITSTSFPGWLNIYLSPTTLGSIMFAITIGFAGGFTGGYFASRGDPFWTLSGGLAGVISVSAGADVYAPTMDYLISMFGGGLAVYAGGVIEKRFRVDDAVGAVAVHGVCGFFGIIAVGLFATGYPTGINNVASSFGGQMMGLMTFLPLGFFGGYIPALILKKAGLLRVPPEVEMEGLDIAEFQRDFFPEFEHPARDDHHARRHAGSSPARCSTRPTGRCGDERHDELILAILTQIAVVGFLFRWMFRKDRRLRELNGVRPTEGGSRMALETAPTASSRTARPDDGTVRPFEECLNGFYTFGPGGALNADDPQTSPFWLGASNGTIVLAIIGFVVFIVVMISWVRVENGKLERQAERLRATGTVPAPEQL